MSISRPARRTPATTDRGPGSADRIIEQILGILIVAGVGLTLGWRPIMGAGGAVELVLLVLLGLFAFTWFAVLLGMVIRTATGGCAAAIGRRRRRHRQGGPRS